MTLVKKKKSNGQFMYVYQCFDCGDYNRSHEKKPLNDVPLFNEELFEANKQLRHEQFEAERKKIEDEWRKKQDEKNAEWWEWYSEYLQTEEWIEKRNKVFERDSYTCQSCLSCHADQVHHLTYKHVGNEPLFDLVSVCFKCHDRITEHDRSLRKST
jgi:hypothetical protein